MNDVICAVSTPFGRGGIAVIRVSGEGAVELCDAVFRTGGLPLRSTPGGRVRYGGIYSGGERIDDGCAAVFRAPHSYTGEDTVEISCHGGVLVTDRVYEAVLAAGARPAGPGEFTRRAFVNGKMDLTRAEAVIDLIDAENEDALRIASASAGGALSRALEETRGELVALISAAYVQSDYPDEDLSGLTAAAAAEKIGGIRAAIAGLLATYRAGHAVTRGIDAVICGAPNVGKSSLLNALLGRDRAIVTDVAGTTRDTVEERCAVGRVMLNLCDTAGVHESDDRVEMLGMERSRRRAAECELALAVIDASRPLDADDRALLCSLDPEKTVVVLNKSDLPSAVAPADLSGFGRAVRLSCLTGEGVDELKSLIERLFVTGEIDFTRPVLTNARQKAALERADGFLAAALDALRAGATPDVAGLDLELAAGALGEADGRAVSEEVVNGIFSRFCVGK